MAPVCEPRAVADKGPQAVDGQTGSSHQGTRRDGVVRSEGSCGPPPATALLRRFGYGVLGLLLLACVARAAWDWRRATVGGQRVRTAYERALDRVTAQVNRAPLDPRLSVRMAHFYLARVNLLASTAHERQHGSTGPGAVESNQEYDAWCRRYLASDPEHAVSDALRMARLGLRQNSPARERWNLLSIEAMMLGYLGRHGEEAVVLRQLASISPDPRALSGRIARAYKEAGQYGLAEAFRRRAEGVPQHLGDALRKEARSARRGGGNDSGDH
jgi:hypothetical protein